MGLFGGILGAASSIAGGIASSSMMREAKKNLKKQRAKNERWYDQRYNEDATQRADAQRILSMTQERLKERNRQVAGSQAIMGGTEESVAAEKAANAKAMADATGQIAVNAEARKDNIEQTYQQRDDNYVNQMNKVIMGQAGEVAKAAQAAGQSFSKMGF